MSSGELSDKMKFLLEEFENSSLWTVHIRRAGVEIHLSRDPNGSSAGRIARAAPEPRKVVTPNFNRIDPDAISQQADAADPSQLDIPEGTSIITAPNLGTFYLSPKPGAAPYVKIGQKIEVGDELCLIEVMKLFTAVRSEKAGTIKVILVADGAMVEAGQPLFAIEED